MDKENFEDTLLRIIVIMVLILVILGIVFKYMYPLAPIIVPVVIICWVLNKVKKKKGK